MNIACAARGGDAPANPQLHGLHYVLAGFACAILATIDLRAALAVRRQVAAILDRGRTSPRRHDFASATFRGQPGIRLAHVADQGWGDSDCLAARFSATGAAPVPTSPR